MDYKNVKGGDIFSLESPGNGIKFATSHGELLLVVVAKPQGCLGITTVLNNDPDQVQQVAIYQKTKKVKVDRFFPRRRQVRIIGELLPNGVWTGCVKQLQWK
jgi:hypothetical protein